MSLRAKRSNLLVDYFAWPASHDWLISNIITSRALPRLPGRGSFSSDLHMATGFFSIVTLNPVIRKTGLSEGFTDTILFTLQDSMFLNVNNTTREKFVLVF
jgi:hypothetical protein